VSGLPVDDDIRHAADRGGHYRSAGGGRLDQCDGRALGLRRQHDHVAGRIERGQIVHPAEEPNPVPKGATRLGLERRSILAVAGNQESRLGARGGDARGRAQERGVVLHRHQAPDDAHDGAVHRQVQDEARLCLEGAILEQRLEVHADRHDVPAILGPDAQGEQLVANPRSHRDEGVGARGERSLHLHERGRLQR